MGSIRLCERCMPCRRCRRGCRGDVGAFVGRGDYEGENRDGLAQRLDHVSSCVKLHWAIQYLSVIAVYNDVTSEPFRLLSNVTMRSLNASLTCHNHHNNHHAILTRPAIIPGAAAAAVWKHENSSSTGLSLQNQRLVTGIDGSDLAV